MAIREIKDLYDKEKNKNLTISLIIHLAWIPLGIIFVLFDLIFSPSYDAWPNLLVEIISNIWVAYFSTAIIFGLTRFLFVFLGIMTHKDFKIYITFFVLFIVFKAERYTGILDMPLIIEDNVFYVIWTIILITSFMNRFNNMSQKIKEIHEKLNDKT